MLHLGLHRLDVIRMNTILSFRKSANGFNNRSIEHLTFMESRVNNSHQVENSILRPCLTQPGWENGIEK